MAKYESLFIDDVQALAGDIGLRVGDGAVDDPLAAFLRGPGDVRRNDAVLGVKQRVVLGDRLRGDDVDGGGGDFSRVQRVRQVLLHHYLPAAVVDDDHAVLHFFDVALVDKPFAE